MFINFSSVITWMFRSFDIAGDTKLLEKLEKEEVRFLMIIKKHWIYSLLMSWRVVLVIIIACTNVYLLVFSESTPNATTVGIAAFLSINVIWWLIVVVIYIRRFAAIQGDRPYIEDIYSAIRKSRLSDTAFERFFNQTIFLLIILVGITVFVLLTSMASILLSGGTSASFGMINAFLLIIEV